MKIIPDRFTHFYLPDGTPFWTVPKKDGTGDRPTTIKDAREAGAFPSVTEILRVIAKPQLEDWKLEQAILAALTLPRIENEPLEAFARRVVADSQNQGKQAMEFGKRIHAALENYPTEPEADLKPFLDSVFEWLNTEVEYIHGRETVVVNKEMGYAGTFDLFCDIKEVGPACVDFKTQAVKTKAVFYNEWPLQLVAYAKAIYKQGPLPAIVSVVINSKEPSPIAIKRWDEDSSDDYWIAFCSAFDLWCYLKEYRPLS